MKCKIMQSIIQIAGLKIFPITNSVAAITFPVVIIVVVCLFLGMSCAFLIYFKKWHKIKIMTCCCSDRLYKMTINCSRINYW